MRSRLLVIEHEPDASLDLMAAPLARGAHLSIVRPYQGEKIPALDEDPSLAGLLVLGGSMSAWDDETAPWLPATRALLAQAVRRELPTLGICLGAQLLALATGGTVERGGSGLEVGLVAVTPVPAAAGDRFFGPLGSLSPGVDQYHFDAVTVLPSEGELLVTGEHYAVQGFRVGAAAWGVQYHPEVSLPEFERWVANGVRSGEVSSEAEVLTPVRAAAAAQSTIATGHSDALLNILVT